ncbi:MAG TPA: C45 family peptidase, partial [Gaiellales bacterium]
MAVTSHAIAECHGDGRERGRAHGEALRERIHGLLARWDANVARLGRPPQTLVSGLVETTGFLAAIERHTPDLLAEVRGIGEGSNVGFDRILALNLMDEEWWFTAPAEPRDACTLIAVGPSEGRPSVLAQNMDLPEVMDGAQAIVRHDDGNGDGGTVLTAAGMIGLAGVSSAGLGVCVNTLAMLNHSRNGLPVAFVMRGALAHGSVAGAAAFLGRVPHASGQHYALADSTEVAGYECSAAGAVRSDPGNGRLCHTNHP